MAQRFEADGHEFEAAFRALLSLRSVSDGGADEVARKIVRDVRARGFLALAEHTAHHDGVELSPASLRVTEEEVQAGVAACDRADLDALAFAAERIRAYHVRQLPKDHRFTDEAGVELGWRWTPLASVGLYVPGGRASYPSSVLMNAAPAVVAGVERIVMVSPAATGTLNPMVLAAAREAGVKEIYRVGGAQAVAALAYGAGPIAPVDKIVGPGNAYVTAAKRVVFGDVGIDTIAGPSEILVVSDARNSPEIIAIDLLSQAEHDPMSQSILITDDPAFADAVDEAVEAALTDLATEKAARASWEQFGAIVLVDDLVEDAPAIIDIAAPEHVEIALDDEEADALTARLRHAGAIFLGRRAPEALGDYVTGSNHVLPTARAARFASGLSVTDFMKRTSVQRIGSDGLEAIGPAAARLARLEGLPAHAASVEMRLSEDGGRGDA